MVEEIAKLGAHYSSGVKVGGRGGDDSYLINLIIDLTKRGKLR